jgi:3-hydroxyacyl-CoA dehydrogenase
MINEGARALDEGYVLRASDIDVIYVNGCNFPSWRSGPMFCADTVGLDKVMGVCRFLSASMRRWKVAHAATSQRHGKTFKFDAIRKCRTAYLDRQLDHQPRRYFRAVVH